MSCDRRARAREIRREMRTASGARGVPGSGCVASSKLMRARKQKGMSSVLGFKRFQVPSEP
eukprot:3235474-Prymnesium_polylepis.1